MGKGKKVFFMGTREIFAHKIARFTNDTHLLAEFFFSTISTIKRLSFGLYKDTIFMIIFIKHIIQMIVKD